MKDSSSEVGEIRGSFLTLIRRIVNEDVAGLSMETVDLHSLLRRTGGAGLMEPVGLRSRITWRIGDTGVKENPGTSMALDDRRSLLLRAGSAGPAGPVDLRLGGI